MRSAAARLRAIVPALICIYAAWQPGIAAAQGRGYVSYLTGNAADVAPTTHGGLLLVGGGADRNDALQWLVDQAGGGDIVVLRASGADGYNDLLVRLGADSVESLVFSSARAAHDPEVLDKLRRAEGIFFAGGNQANYVAYFKDTPLESELNAAAARGVPIGGTSAGLAILGEFLYPAQNASTDSRAALADPFNRGVMVERDFLAMPRLGGLITDSHFGARDRMGRLLTFMARIMRGGWITRGDKVRGVGVDERTALAIDDDGMARVFASTGKVYMLASSAEPAICVAGTPLTFAGVQVVRLQAGSTFDLNNWTGTGTLEYELDVNAGVVTSSSGSVY